jgi:hypothetical protein
MTEPEVPLPAGPGEFVRDPSESKWRRDPAAITNEEPAAEPVEAQAPPPEQPAPALPPTPENDNGISRPDPHNQSRGGKGHP